MTCIAIFCDLPPFRALGPLSRIQSAEYVYLFAANSFLFAFAALMSLVRRLMHDGVVRFWGWLVRGTLSDVCVTVQLLSLSAPPSASPRFPASLWMCGVENPTRFATLLSSGPSGARIFLRDSNDRVVRNCCKICMQLLHCNCNFICINCMSCLLPPTLHL